MKQGIKTSEFWVSTIVSLATILNQSGLLGSIVLPLEAVGSIAFMVSTYVISRGIAKKQ